MLRAKVSRVASRQGARASVLRQGPGRSVHTGPLGNGVSGADPPTQLEIHV